MTKLSTTLLLAVAEYLTEHLILAQGLGGPSWQPSWCDSWSSSVSGHGARGFPHPLRLSQPPPTAPPAGDQVFKHMNR